MHNLAVHGIQQTLSYIIYVCIVKGKLHCFAELDQSVLSMLTVDNQAEDTCHMSVFLATNCVGFSEEEIARNYSDKNKPCSFKLYRNLNISNEFALFLFNSHIK